MKLRRLLVPAVVLSFALAIAAVPGFAISKEFKQSYSLQPGGTFELQNVNGTIEVQGWDKDVVEVHAVKTAKVRESDLERVAIDVQTKSDGIAIMTRYPQNEGDSDVHAHTTNGNVHLELSHVHGASGTVAETTNGSVVLAVPANAQADLEARCLNGNFQSELPFAMEGSLKPREIHGKLGRGGSPIKLHTINGGIRVVALRTTV